MQKNGGRTGLPTAVKIAINVAVLAALIIVIAVLYANVPVDGEPGAAIDYPKEWDFRWDTIKWIDGVVDWVVVNWSP